MPLFGKEKNKTSTAAKKDRGAPVCKLDPWREFEENGSWTKDYNEKLLKEIKNWNPKEDSIQNIRILLLGPIKAGKSSFMNTVSSIDKGRIAEVAVAGGGFRCLTKTLQIFRPEDKLRNFRLLDTMGVEEGDMCGLNEDDILYIVNGNIYQNYEFNPVSPIKLGSKFFIKTPKQKDKVQCVVFVMDANAAGQNNITEAARRKTSSMQSKLESQSVPVMVLLTKIDKLCARIDTDITYCYKSEALMKAVYKAAQLFKVPESYVFPVKNYTNEAITNSKTDILILLALRHMIYIGTDFLHSIELSDDKDEDEDNMPKIATAETQDLVDFINFHEFKGIFL